MVGIPAYNEARYIGSVVLQARQHADEVLVVDDGSTDETAKIATLAGATVVRFDDNRGKGAAIQEILAQAREKRPRALVLLDADAQHDPADIPTLIRPVEAEGIDLVVGSRESQRQKTPRYRRLGQRVLLRATRLLSRHDISDSESGFRALSHRATESLRLRERGFAVEAEMLTQAAHKGLKISEVPISNIYTGDGSTLHPVRHGVGVLTRIMNMISRKKPLLFFGLVGLAFLVAGLVVGINVLNIAATAGSMPLGSVVLTSLLLTIGVLSVFTGIMLDALIRHR